MHAWEEDGQQCLHFPKRKVACTMKSPGVLAPGLQVWHSSQAHGKKLATACEASTIWKHLDIDIRDLIIP